VVYGSHKPYMWVYEMFKVWIQFGVEREWVLKKKKFFCNFYYLQ
jgi:hypothetical protein